MSTGQTNVLHGLLFPSAAFISEFSSSQTNINVDELTGLASGHAQPLFTGGAGERPDYTFSTPQIATLLTALGLYGTDLSAGNTDVYQKAATDLGNRVADGTTSHHRLRMANAFGYVTSIRAAHGQVAEISARIVPSWDGSTVPLTPAGSVALSGTAAAIEYFTLGPVKINGTALAGVQEWSLDLGCQIAELSSDGDIYTSFIYLKEIIPTISVRGTGTDWQATYGTAGTALSALTLYLRRRAVDGYNVSGSTNIAITATNGTVRFDGASGAGNDPLSTMLKIRPRAASSAANVLAFDAASAIS
ncbi:MAG: hypothetical protein AB7O62_00385 [Pirellulales bacterium]